MSIAVPLCGFGGGDLPKSKIVNNFTTTEEGYVADARALKVLNDSKLSMELLWENPSPTSTFEPGIISVDLTKYDFFLVDFIYNIADPSVVISGIGPVGGYISCSWDFIQPSNNTFAILNRTVHSKDKTSVTVKAGVRYQNNNTSAEVNSVIVPCRIYGIKGVSV